MLSFDFYPTNTLEQTGWERTGLMISSTMRIYEHHEDLATSIILSRMTREMRRHHGVERTKTMLAALAQPPDDMEVDAGVFVPNKAFRLDDTARRVWDQVGRMVDQLIAVFGDEIAFSIIASRMMTWMQHRHGSDQARRGLAKVMQGFIDTMSDADRLDQLHAQTQ